MTQQLVLLHVLTVAHGRNDVPVAEPEITVDDRQRPAAFEMHNTGPDRIDRGAVCRRDINPEMERPRRTRDPRVVEIAAHRMRPPKRLQRPPVQAPQNTRPRAVNRRGSSGTVTPALAHAYCVLNRGIAIYGKLPSLRFVGRAEKLDKRMKCLQIGMFRALSSVGRAPARQAGGHWFEPSSAHHTKALQMQSFRRLRRQRLSSRARKMLAPSAM